MLLYKQVGLFLIWMQSKNKITRFCDFRLTDLRQERDDRNRVGERKHKLSSPIENIVITGPQWAAILRAAIVGVTGFEAATHTCRTDQNANQINSSDWTNLADTRSDYQLVSIQCVPHACLP